MFRNTRRSGKMGLAAIMCLRFEFTEPLQSYWPPGLPDRLFLKIPIHKAAFAPAPNERRIRFLSGVSATSRPSLTTD